MGGKTRNQTTTVQERFPEWVNQAGAANVARANEIAARPFQSYEGERVAGFTGDQFQAFDRVRNLQGSGAQQMAAPRSIATGVGEFRPDMVRFAGGPADVTAQRFTDANLGAYLNPYLSQVEDSAMSALARQRGVSLRDAGDAAIAAGAFGGSRHGVREGVIDAETARAAAEASARIRSEGFNTAAGLIGRDQAAALQAGMGNQQTQLAASQSDLQAQSANQQAQLAAAGLRLNAAGSLAQMAGQERALTAGEIDLLSNSGAMQQALQQAQADDAYQRFVEARDYDINMLNLRSGVLSATPFERGQATTTPVTRPSALMQGLGAAAQVASVAGMFMSDRREKTDIEPIGRNPETGERLYAYRYKSDVEEHGRNTPKIVGPMAQDIESSDPSRVMTTTSGKKVVRGLMGVMG